MLIGGIKDDLRELSQWGNSVIVKSVRCDDKISDYFVRKYAHVPLVVDPVMVSSSGDQLLEDDAVLYYRKYLIPLASLITPNMREAEILLGRRLNIGGIKDDLRELSQWGNSVIVKSVRCDDKISDYFRMIALRNILNLLLKQEM